MQKLTVEEIDFLLIRILDDRRYYGALAASERCSEYSKKMWTLVNSVGKKLENAKVKLALLHSCKGS